MEVTSVLSTQTTSSATDSTDSTALGKDEFLKILVAQLQNQDPLSPMDTADFMGQLAELSTLEELQNLHSSFDEFASSSSLLNAADLIGKDVIYLDSALGTYQQGTVDSVEMGDDGVQVYVGDTVLALDEIVAVTTGTT